MNNLVFSNQIQVKSTIIVKGDNMKEQIFDNYYDKLYYWSLNKTKNIEDAKDLVNDIFVAIYTYLDKGIKIEKLDNLIWTIASNCWKKQVIKYRKDHNIINDENIIENASINNNYIIEKIIYEDIINNLDNCRLTEKEKQIFIHYYKKDLSVKQISAILNINEANIKYYLYSARKKIKERYDD